MGLFDKLGIGSGRSFYARDFRNAYHLRPDTNPPRQKFQGYVNFILNRNLFDKLFGSVDNSVFRTQISSLVRKASLPDVNFKTEIKNSYNRKKIIQTGLEYDPVSITVIDTVGNEWLSMVMNYYSYHFMNIRNKTASNDRDAQRPAGTETLMLNSKFGSTGQTDKLNIDQEAVFDSNSYGYNTNLDPNFFERIDLVLYHGNKGVQYSLVHPVLKSLKMGDIDYSSSDIMEYELTFDYENFVPYSVTNFGLTDADVQRFEQAYKFVGPAFEEGRKPIALDEPNTLSTLGTLREGGQISEADQKSGNLKRYRSGQPGVPVELTEEQTQEQDNPTTPDVAANTDDVPPAAADATTNDAAAATAASGSPAFTGNPKSKLPDVYGNSAKFADANGKSKKNSFLDNLLGNVAGAAVGAALSGKSIKNAVVGAAAGTVVSEVTRQANNLQRPARATAEPPPPPGENPQQTPGDG